MVFLLFKQSEGSISSCDVTGTLNGCSNQPLEKLTGNNIRSGHYSTR